MEVRVTDSEITTLDSNLSTRLDKTNERIDHLTPDRTS